MRGIIIYITFILFITVIVPVTLTEGCDILSGDKPIIDDEKIEKIEKEEMIKIYNTKTKKVEEMKFEEYIKGVVAAEMPAEFNIEALKAQAVAARTYAIYRINKFKGGHPDHPKTSLCTGIHCQAWLSLDDLRSAHSKNWMYEYWPKIEKAVDGTKGEIVTYNSKPIEPLFHSTSGGMTEDSEDVFSSAAPYLRGVVSPYEQGAPKLQGKKQLSINEFINKIKSKFPSIDISKSNLASKIELLERSEGGRIKKIRIDNEIVSGRDIRSLFNLNSTNFKISVFTKDNIIRFDTIGYGHGVGMSQWGANGMAKEGAMYTDILKHFYQGVKIEKIY